MLSMNLAIGRALKRQGRNYLHSLKQARKNLSAERVHNLRKATRRLQAALQVAGCFVRDPDIHFLDQELENLRRTLGPLRNIQVEIKSVSRNKSLDSLLKFLRKREKKLKRRMREVFTEIKVKNQKRAIETVVNHVISRQKEEPRKHGHNLKDWFNMRVQRFEKIRSSKDLHWIRTEAKKLRYEGEILNAIGTGPISLRPFERIQSSVGKIQDGKVMLKSIDRYLDRKTGKKVVPVETLKEHLLANQERLTESIRLSNV